MTSNMEFTDKTQQSLTDAVQLAKDYANAQGMSPCILLSGFLLTYNHSTSCASRLRFT